MTSAFRYPRDEWMNHAACFGLDPDVFFDPARKEEGRRVCHGCPVREQCLEYALTHRLNRDMDGMWGALTPAQRRGVLRRRAISRRIG